MLSLREKIGYALGDSASNFYWKVHEFFVLFFYTDVFGISAGAAGTMFLVVRIGDAIADPLMGLVADRTRSRFGRFRPYLAWMPVPLALAGVLMFTTPELEPGAKLGYAYATYVLFFLCYTAINIPYSALMGVITPDTQERAELSSLRFVGAFGVALLVQTFTPSFARALGGENAQRGWQLAMLVYGAVACALFYLCFASTKERVLPPPHQNSSVREDFRALSHNAPWLVMLVLGTLVITGFALRGGTLYYYFKYYLGNETAFAGFMLSGGIAALAGTALMPLGTRLVGKQRLYLYCMGGAGLLTLPYSFLDPGNLVWVYVLNVGIAFLLGPTPALMFAMFTDTADYGEWKTGRRTTGFVMAAAMLSLKLGGALGGAANGWILQAYGFVPNRAQSPTTLTGILLLMGIVPAATCVLAALTSLLYRLDDSRVRTIQAELAERRLAAPSAGT
jgi:GPH family glycoside/pentoside/hexuronide:cation symporter